MTDARRLYEANMAQLEDFWGRRDDGPLRSRPFSVFGRPVLLESNLDIILTAVDFSLPLYSEVPSVAALPFKVQVIARSLIVPDAARVDDIIQNIDFVGQDEWISMRLGPWGFAHADLVRGQANVVIDHSLAERPELFSRAALNTILLNLCLGSGYAMLHASCLVRDGRVLLLMAPHNTGKSTTALHLIRSGFALVSDSMVHVVPNDDTTAVPLLAGFPTRRIKLRGDMVDSFPEFRPYLIEELVRDESKYVVDLTKIDPRYCVNEAVAAESVTLCLLERQDSSETTWHPASQSDVQRAIMQNSLFYDSWTVWEQNLRGINRLLTGTQSYRLMIGGDTMRMLDAVEALWEDSAAESR